MSKIKPLGRWHKWWLKQFKSAWEKRDPVKRIGGGIAVMGWEGTVQGKALCGLMDRGLIDIRASFEGGLDQLCITEAGLQYTE